MGELKRKATTKPASGGFFERLSSAAKPKERIFVVMSDGLCLEFRAPTDDAEFDAIANTAKRWVEKRLTKTAPSAFINKGPKSAKRFGMCWVAHALMVAGYDSYEVDDEGNITPIGDPHPPLTFEEWLSFARDNWDRFDAIMAAADRESVRSIDVQRSEEFEAEGKE